MTGLGAEPLWFVDPALGPLLPRRSDVGRGARLVPTEDVLEAARPAGGVLLHVLDRPAALAHRQLEPNWRRSGGTYVPLTLLGSDISVGPISGTGHPCAACAWRRREARRGDRVVTDELVAWHRSEAGRPAFAGFSPADLSAVWSFGLALAHDISAGDPPDPGVVWALDVQRTSWTAHRFVGVWSCPVCAPPDGRGAGSPRLTDWIQARPIPGGVPR